MYRQRAEDNFRTAALQLRNALPPATCSRLGQVSFPHFNDSESLESRTKHLQMALQGFIMSRGDVGIKQGDRKMAEDFVTNWFRISYPFASLFLTVAKAASSAVCSSNFTRIRY